MQRGGRGTAVGEGAPARLWEPPLLCLKIFGFQGPDQIRDQEISPLIQFQLFLFYHPTYLRPHSTKYQANDTILDYLSLHKYFRGQRQSRGLANLILLIIIIFRTGHIRQSQCQCWSVSGGLHPLHWPPLPAAVTAGRERWAHYGGAGGLWWR